jgi:probable rRNA maturation factor
MMPARLRVRNESTHKRLYRRDVLTRLADRICAGENVAGDVEISVLFCDDPFMQDLNKQYRGKNAATDVLSFELEDVPTGDVRVLGDIVVSLETVDRNCGSDPAEMREEVRLLVCHGILHLLGYDHGTVSEKKEMTARQADYLGISEQAAWAFGPKKNRVVDARTGGL